MPKPNLVALPRPKMPERVITFEVNGEPVELRLRKLGVHGLTLALENAEAFNKRFEKSEGLFPMPFGGAVKVTEAISQQLAVLEMMQVADSPDDRWDIENLLGLMVNLPEAYQQVAQAVAELNEGPYQVASGDPGNASGAGTGA